MTVKVNMGNDSSSNTLGMVQNIMGMFGGKKGNSQADAMKRRKKKKDEEFGTASEPAGITGSN